jgi:hypothetical protein
MTPAVCTTCRLPLREGCIRGGCPKVGLAAPFQEIIERYCRRVVSVVASFKRRRMICVHCMGSGRVVGPYQRPFVLCAALYALVTERDDDIP